MPCQQRLPGAWKRELAGCGASPEELPGWRPISPCRARPPVLPAPQRPRASICSVCLNLFLCLFGVLLPTMLAAHIAPSTWRPPQPADRQPALEAVQGCRQQQRSGAALKSAVRFARRIPAAAERGWCHLDVALGDCCRGTGYEALHLLLCGWLLLGNTWLCVKAAALRSLLGGPP